jgi:arylsulfatase A-like enzyme
VVLALLVAMVATGREAATATSDAVRPTAADAGAPNVLVVTLDTTRADHCSSYGYARPTTPVLDRLAREGVLFEAAYTATPTTAPSHASLFTSTYPLRHGVVKNGYRLAPEYTTLAEVLHGAGYRTAAVTSSFVVTARFGLDQGFAHYDDVDTIDPAEPPRRWKAYSEKGKAERLASETTDRALAWLRGATSAQPFFLWVHYFDAHHPYDPPAGFREQVDRPVRAPAEARDELRETILAYDGEIRFADEQLGRLIAHLDTVDSGGGRGTIVVVTTDHGEGLHQHGWESHGMQLYEEVVRVALVVRWPGRIGAGRRLREPVALIDIAPTVLSLVGAPRDGLAAEGTDLSGALLRGDSLVADRPLYYQRRLYRTPTHRGADTREPMFAIRRGPWKLVATGPEVELFDLESDPGETRSLHHQEPARAAALAAELERWRSRYADPGSGRQVISDEDRRRLRALGYIE